MEPKNAIEKANNGQDLTQDQRQKAVKYLMVTEDLEASEMADKLDVSYRTIYRDKKAVREELDEELLGNHSLAGRLAIEYEKTQRELAEVVREAKGSGNLRQWRLATRDKFKTAREFADVIGDMQILERIKRLENQVKNNEQR